MSICTVKYGTHINRCHVNLTHKTYLFFTKNNLSIFDHIRILFYNEFLRTSPKPSHTRNPVVKDQSVVILLCVMDGVVLPYMGFLPIPGQPSHLQTATTFHVTTFSSGE